MLYKSLSNKNKWNTIYPTYIEITYLRFLVDYYSYNT